MIETLTKKRTLVVMLCVTLCLILGCISIAFAPTSRQAMAAETNIIYLGGDGAKDTNTGEESTPVATLKKALELVTDGGSIVLKANIDRSSDALAIGLGTGDANLADKSVKIVTNGFILTQGGKFVVNNNRTLTLDDSAGGEFNIINKINDSPALTATDGTITVTSVETTLGYGIRTDANSNVTVRKNIKGKGYGLRIDMKETAGAVKVAVGGNIDVVTTGSGIPYAVTSSSNSANPLIPEITIGGNVAGISGNAGNITVEGNVEHTHGISMSDKSRGNIHVKGDILTTAYSGIYTASSNINITVDGMVKITADNNGYAAVVGSGLEDGTAASTVTVSKIVAENTCNAISISKSGTVIVKGDVDMDTGFLKVANKGTIIVNGTVTKNNTTYNSNIIEFYQTGLGSSYLAFSDGVKATDKAGFLKFTKEGLDGYTVYIKDPNYTPPSDPSDDKNKTTISDNNGNSATFTDENISDDVVLIVTDVTETEDKPVVKEKDEIIGGYDIEIKDGETVVTPSGNIEITIKVGDDIDYKTVYVVDDSGKNIKATSDKPNGTVTFTVTELGIYYVIGSNSGISGGVIAIIIICSIILLLLLIYIILYFTLYKNDKLSGKFWDTIYVPMNAIFGKKEAKEDTNTNTDTDNNNE